ncbi:MAG: DUF3455 domain-containing protein [Vicinamibacterales bacterium]
MSKHATLTVVVAAVLSLHAAAAPQAADRDRGRRPGRVERPAVPANLEVDPEYRPYLITRAQGTQNYLCLPSSTGVAWTFFGPQATLFDEAMDQVMTHYLSPNPQESGLARATWRHSRDTSTVWAMAVESSTDAAFVAPGAIPWLKLQVVGAQYGPHGGDRLTATAFIQRVNTAGGVAPATGCAGTADLGKRALVPYTTAYVFYR